MPEPDDFMQRHIGSIIDTPESIHGKMIGEEVIVYGISKNMIPTGENTGIIYLENDRTFASSKDVVYIEIDENNNLSKIIKEGITNFLYNRQTFVRGHIKDRKVVTHMGNTTIEYLIKPDYDIRVVL
ncbi:MAG: hypothetical protein ABRQ39_31590 [Candidatus Eremiobacterota bacterium]